MKNLQDPWKSPGTYHHAVAILLQQWRATAAGISALATVERSDSVKGKV
jgi:hypothetical protein